MSQPPLLYVYWHQLRTGRDRLSLATTCHDPTQRSSTGEDRRSQVMARGPGPSGPGGGR